LPPPYVITALFDRKGKKLELDNELPVLSGSGPQSKSNQAFGAAQDLGIDRSKRIKLKLRAFIG
jgi:hypothetical protein